MNPQNTPQTTQEEASHRLSFLAEIVDTEGKAIKNPSMQDNYVAEASTAPDIFDNSSNNSIDHMINQEQTKYHDEVINRMRKAIDEAETINSDQSIKTFSNHQNKNQQTTEQVTQKTENISTKPIKPSIIELANNSDYSVETIQKEANRINNKDEVYIALR